MLKRDIIYGKMVKIYVFNNSLKIYKVVMDGIVGRNSLIIVVGDFKEVIFLGRDSLKRK